MGSFLIGVASLRGRDKGRPLNDRDEEWNKGIRRS
jgi:hypothetical protein